MRQPFESEKTFRPLSFWSLNDKLTEETLRAQIKDMEETGYGGYFFHARGGLETPYMSEEWLSLFRAAVDEARKRGMDAWLYDENCWPSGTCGNTIAGKDPAFRETHLFYAFDRIPHDPEDVIAAYAYLTDLTSDGVWTNYRLFRPAPPRQFTPLSPEEAEKIGNHLPEDRRLLFIYVWRAPLCNPRFGGQSYVDLLNPAMTDAFLASTHEKYREAAGDEFGKTIPGTFTDDVTLKWDLFGAKGQAIPWTSSLPDLFREDYGYDLTKKLPDLFFDTPGAEATRFDYYRLINRLFNDNYIGRIADWCDKNGLLAAGHLMGNEGLFTDVMYTFYLEGVPTIDSLGGVEMENFRKYRRMKSVAEQFDKPMTLCECFAGGGHDMTPETQRRQTDFMLFAGASTLVFHVGQYSLRGTRKYDHPPTFSSHNPGWGGDYAPLSRYQARLGSAMTRGRQAADVLVIDPIESKFITRSQGEAGEIDAALNATEKTLLDAHVEFAYGSEYLLSRFGAVEGGKLRLGSAAYSAVIIPFARTLREGTVRLLRALRDAGGTVLCLGKLPAFADGRPAPDLRETLRARFVALNDLPRELARFAFCVEDGDGVNVGEVRTALRRVGDETLVFLTDCKGTRPRTVFIPLPADALVTLHDLHTGESMPAPLSVRDGKTVFKLSLPAGGSALFSITPGAGALPAEAPGEWVTVARRRPAFPMPVTFDRPNLLMIEKYAVEAEGESDFSDYMYAEGLKCKGGFILKATFTVKGWTGEGGRLIWERPSSFRSLTLNGTPLPRDSREWLIDPSFASLPLAGAIREGENILLAEADPTCRCEIMPAYLAGDFSVREEEGALVVSGQAPRVFSGDLTGEGMPFYAGSADVSLSFTLPAPNPERRYFLRFAAPHMMLCRVRVNDCDAGVLWDTPYETEVTEYLRAGENRVTVTLHGSLRNALGPHHLRIPGQPKPFISPATFARTASYTDAYSFVPLGWEDVVLEEREYLPNSVDFS